MEDHGASTDHPIDDSVTVTASEPLSSATMALPLGAPDVLTAGFPAELSADATLESLAGASAPPRRPRRRLVAALVAAGVTVTLLLGVGAYVAYQKLFLDGRHPDQFTPGSVAAFVDIDLDVSFDQQLKLARLAEKFGQRGGGLAGTDSKPKDALSGLLDGLHLTGVDVKRDLTSWLGLRAAFSLWLDDKSHPYALISATSTDDAKATAGLGRVKAVMQGGDLGFVVHDGSALIAIGDSGGQAAADAASAEAVKAPLNKLTSFQDGKRWLGDGQMAIVWMDMERYGQAAAAVFDGAIGGMSPPSPTSAYHGTAITGVRVTADGFEARYRTFNAQKKTGALHDAVTRLSDLPSNTAVGAVLTVPEMSSVDSVQAGAFGAILGGLSGVLFSSLVGPSIMEFPFGGPTPRVYTDAETKEIDALMAKDPAHLTAAESKRLKELTGISASDMMDPTPLPTDVGSVEPPPGFGGSDPFKAWSGATVTVAVTRFVGGPSLRIRAETASADAATAIAGLLPTVPNNFVATVQGSTVTVASKDYVSSGGTLADDAAFKKVMAGAPAQTELAVYVNFDSVLTADERGRFPIQAIGMVQGMDGSEQVGLMRVVIG